MQTRGKHERDIETEVRQCRQRVDAFESRAMGMGNKRARVSQTGALVTLEHTPDERICACLSYARLGKRCEKFAELEGSTKFLAAGIIVLRFMHTFATSQKTTRALALATVPPPPTGATSEQAMICGHAVFVRRIQSGGTLRAMSRFVRHSGLFQNMTSVSTHASVVASCLLRSFDICGNPRFYGDSCNGSYRASPGPYGAAVSTATGSELVRVASILESTFTVARQRVLLGESQKSIGGGEAEKMALCVHLQQFEMVFRTWRHEHSGGIQKRVQMVLFNIYDTRTILHNGLLTGTNCCIRKPFLQEAARRYTKDVISIENKFLKASGSVGAMLSGMKRTYFELRGCVGIFDDCINVPISPHTNVHGRHEKSSRREMQRILHEQRSSWFYSMEEIHHETVLDASFNVKNSHLHRDDVCLLEASRVYAEGMKNNLRVQIQGGDMQVGVPVYRHALQAIKAVREHLIDLDIHTDYDMLCKHLDETQLKRWLDNGTLSWKKVLRTLHAIVHGMQFCVGTEVARTILYERRLRDFAVSQTRAGVVSYDIGPCGTTERLVPRYHKIDKHILDKNLKKWQNKSRAVGQLFIRDDSAMYGMAQESYLILMTQLKGLKNADLSHSTIELGGLFCEALFNITAEMRKLDVSLTNADICATRLCSTDHNIRVEQKTFDVWFSRGLRVHNTLRWLQQSAVHGSEVSVMGLVFDGYISLVMDPVSQQLDEVDYPELVIFDITYIQKARGVFFGQVAQATILVIIGQRLTDVGISGTDICGYLNHVSMTPGFIDFGRPETCRGEKRVQDTLQDALRLSLYRLTSTYRTQTNFHEGILQEVARETCHHGYPSSPIASNIACKWTMATRMASPTMQGACTMFASPEATRAAFTEHFHIPKAALHLSCDFHFTTLEFVRRVVFNVAVHKDRYRELVHKL